MRISPRIDITTYTAEPDDVDDTLFPHGSTMPAGAGQPPVIGSDVFDEIARTEEIRLGWSA